MVSMHVRMRDGLLFGVNVLIFGTAVAVAYNTHFAIYITEWR